MKKATLITVFSFVSLLMIAQSNIRLNNYWGNTYYINPASIYDKYQGVLSMAARKQWVGVEGSPMTFFASASTYIENINTQVGLIAVQDKIGYSSVTNIDFTYAYAIKMKHDWQLHLGLGVNYQNLSYNVSKVNLSDNFDSHAYENLLAEGNFNSDIGVELTNKTFKIGASSMNLFSVFSTNHSYQTNTNFIYTKYRQMSNNPIDVGLGICGIQYSNMYQAEFNLTGYFKVGKRSGLSEIPDLFNVGLFYRTGSEIGFILGLDLTEAVHLSYSYDYNVSSINRNSIGTNELMITYNITRRKTCHNCWH